MIAARQFGVLNPIHTSNYLPEVDTELPAFLRRGVTSRELP